MSQDIKIPLWVEEIILEADAFLEKNHNDYANGEFFKRFRYYIEILDDPDWAWGQAYSYGIEDGLTQCMFQVNPTLLEENPKNKFRIKLLVIHSVLHLIHPSWKYDRIEKEEKRLAKKGKYWNELKKQDDLWYSNYQYRLCGLWRCVKPPKKSFFHR